MFADRAWDPSHVDPALDARAATFENPTGARGAGGSAFGGRKGAPNKLVLGGERVALLDTEGPGTVRHVWMTFLPGEPEAMRSLHLEVFYDDLDEPSVAAPCLDLFGLPHGRPVAYESALLAAQEGRGFGSWIPMPFRRRIRIELVNGGEAPALLYYQVDFTLGPVPEDAGLLHVTFRRQNPTTMGDDFVITEGLRGPGRFLGCNVGVRTIDPGSWYGEGEVKVFRDGDADLPTICGTGLEDYVGSAWGMGAHATAYGGAPLVVGPPGSPRDMPDFVGFYRWHLPDPIMFATDLKVTIQQIGAMAFRPDEVDARAEYERTNPLAGIGQWIPLPIGEPRLFGIVERVDDYCATAYVYCTEPQPVPRLDLAAALADIARRPYEPDPSELLP